MRDFRGEMPARIRALKVDHRGFPIPWFVAYDDSGRPVFPAMDPAKWKQAVAHRRCWVCGEPMGRFLCFVIGPMCGVNRVTAEPPCHLDCATWSVMNCPFLANPNMRRVPTKHYAGDVTPQVAGIMIERNPGVSLLWPTEGYRLEKAGAGYLFRLDDPAQPISFWKEGRIATRAEIDHAIETGLPALYGTLKLEPNPALAKAEIDAHVARFITKIDAVAPREAA